MTIIGVDTEAQGFGGAPWSVQYSTVPNKSLMILATNTEHLRGLGELLAKRDVLTVVHNALFDIPVLHQLGIYPHKVADTMVMAYLLGEGSLRLKTLAYRYCGMEMESYTDVTKQASEDKAYSYLNQVLAVEWDKPIPVLETRTNGDFHVKRPQSINTRVKKYMKKYEEGEAKMSLVEYWRHKDRTADREMVEPALGILEPGYLSDIPFDTAVQYACHDADASHQLYFPLWRQIQQNHLEEVFWRDMGIIPMAVSMMENGIMIDPEHFAKLEVEFADRMLDIANSIEAECGHYLNPGSSKQVTEVLTSMGIDVRDSSADELDKHRHHPIVQLIQDYRGYGKLNSTYVSVLPTLMDDNNRVHTKLSLTRTDTGRLASSNPNLQNQPVRTEDGRKIRQGFTSAPDCSFVALDYSQIELRVAAHVSQDPAMLSIYRNDGDIHLETACALFGLDIADIDDKKHRRPAKTVNFGILYGITGYGLLEAFYHEGITNFTEDDCRGFIDVIKGKYPGYFEWVANTKAFARDHGYVQDLFGRRRWIPEIYSTHRWIQAAGMRMVVNTPIQSAAGGVIKEAMVQLTPLYERSGEIVRPILQIHDELIFEVEDGAVDAVVREFKPIMENVVQLSIPFLVDAEVGKNWNELKPWKGE